MFALSRVLVVSAVLLAIVPARAADVVFSGSVTSTCTLVVAVPGVLSLSLDGTRLGSDQPGGLSATLNIVSLGTNTVTVDPPTRTGSPGGYVSTGEQLRVAYVGLGGLSLVNQAYTTSSTSFSTAILPLTSLLIDNEIENAGGFAQGAYETTTVVTCS